MESNLFEMSYFRAPITNKVPQKTVTLQEVVGIIRSTQLGLQTQNLRAIKDHNEARLYKGCHLPYVTPSGVFTYCNDQSLVKHSGLLCMDLDGVDDVEALKQLLTADSHFLTPLAFRSPSGNGLKWFIVIDTSVCDHRTWFHAVRNYLLETYKNLTAKMVDSQCQNVSRACFLCYDPSAYVNLHSVHSGRFSSTARRGKSTDPNVHFDPKTWVEKTVEVRKPVVTAISTARANSQPLHPMEELAKARATVRELLRRGANIADDYGDYVRLGFALANGLGSEGRGLYHQLCSMSPKYREKDCERKWQECMRQNDGRTTIATFYQMAKLAGVDLSCIAREFKPDSIYNF